MKLSFFDSTFFRIFVGITLTAFISLSITQLISLYRLQQSFEQFQEKQVVVFKEWGRSYVVNEKLELPESLKAFALSYKDELLRHVFFSFLVGFLLSIIAGITVSSQIVNPLNRLKKAILLVTKSRYRIRAPEVGSKEMREVNHSFNELIGELDNQEKARLDLIADMSHELKTPLTRIKGQLEAMIDGVYDLNKSNLNKALANIDQLEYLIKALYEVNQISVSNVDLTEKACHVLPIVESSISGFTKKPIKFELQIESKLTILADPNRLKQIIDNLVGNAYKYTTSGTIKISADKKTFKITDTGAGIDTTDLPHIFKRLYRVEKSRSKKTGGLGLGLFIVKKLVNLHGWRINVSSEVGEGSTFVITWG